MHPVGTSILEYFLQIYFDNITSSNCITNMLPTLPNSTFLDAYCQHVNRNVHIGKVKFTLERAMKAQTRSSDIVLLFL